MTLNESALACADVLANHAVPWRCAVTKVAGARVIDCGGAVQGGRVVGASDATAYAPKDRPVTTGEIAATVFHGLGLSLDTELPGPQGRPLRLVDHGVEPIHELF